MIKTCIYCNGDFEVDESNHHERRREYCSQLCRNRAYYLRKIGGKKEIEKTCLECGKVYMAKRCDSVTCGAECLGERNKRRVRENGAIYREKMRAERLTEKERPKTKRKKPETLAEFDRKAREMGMSYGHYDLYLRMQKREVS